MCSWGINVVTLQPTVTFPYKSWVFQWKPVHRKLVKKRNSTVLCLLSNQFVTQLHHCYNGFASNKFNLAKNGTQIIWEGTKLLDLQTLASLHSIFIDVPVYRRNHCSSQKPQGYFYKYWGRGKYRTLIFAIKQTTSKHIVWPSSTSLSTSTFRVNPHLMNASQLN
jgi:hypothetical protein